AAMCRASHVAAEIVASQIPVIGRSVFDLVASGCVPGGSRDNHAEARRSTEWDGVSDGYQALLTDAQTSGGLLFSVAPRHLDVVLRRLAALRTACAAVIGHIERGHPRIRVAA